MVSNLDPTATFTQLLERDALPDAFARRVRRHRPPGRLLPDALRALRACPSTPARTRCSTRAIFATNVTFFGTAEQMQLDYEGCVRGRVPVSPSFNLAIPSLDDPGLAPAGKHAASSFAFYLPIGADQAEQSRLRDEMAERIVAKITAHAPNFPDLIERQFNYPAYTYELMFGCTGGDFTHGLLQPEFMGPFRPGPGVGPTIRSRSTACTCAAPAVTAGPGSPSSPGTTAATPCSTPAASRL